MKVLFVGDIFGKPGRTAVRRLVPRLLAAERIDFAVGNSENAKGGSGVTPEAAEELLGAGLDLLTCGNHTWSKKEILPYLSRPDSRQLRPENYPSGTPGRGHAVLEKRGLRLGVLNLEGRTFMRPLECPFRAADRVVEELRRETPCILVDMHCEATSEKNAMGHYLDGRVSAVIGSHTHVQTADERLLPRGTAYLTDAGMCGPWDSVVGARKELAIQRFLTQRPSGREVASGEIYLQGALVEVDEATGRARSIRRVQQRLEE